MPTSGFLRNQCRKTQLCQAFETAGTCGRGRKCRFAHGASELRQKPDLNRTQLCPSLGRCHDPACAFAHAESELRAFDQPAPEVQAAPAPPAPSAALLATEPSLLPWMALKRVALKALECCESSSVVSTDDGESSPSSPWSSEASDVGGLDAFVVKNTFLELWEEQDEELPVRKCLSAQGRLEGRQEAAPERSRRRRHSEPEAFAMPR